MKRTVPHNKTQVFINENALRGSIKNQAENLMGVDLIIIDLDMIYDVGGITVSKIIYVENYTYAHQIL